MNLLELGLYVLTIVVMIATPGPVMLLVASAGLKNGYRAALKTILGTNFASLILIAISISVLKGILSINELVFIIIKLLGSLYIAYIGIDLFKEVRQTHTTSMPPISTAHGGFKKGFLVGISNPKDIIFFSSFFPQFIGIHHNINISLSILVIVWIMLDFITLSIVYKMFHTLSKSKFYPKFLASCALLFIFIAAYGIYTSIQSFY